MTTPSIDPAAFQAFLAQLAAQQQQTPAASVPAPTVTPAEPVAELAPTVDVDIEDVLGGGAYGPKLFEKTDPIGTSYTGTLAKLVTAKQDRDFKTKQPKFYDDAKTRPVPYLIVPLDVPVSERFPDGRATWYARGKDIAELSRAASEAGVPQDVIKKGLEPGATITVKYERNQVNPNFPDSNPAKIRSVKYTRPGQPATPAQVVPVAVTPTAPGATHVPVQPATPAPAAGLERPPGLTDEQYAVFLKALGQQPAA